MNTSPASNKGGKKLTDIDRVPDYWPDDEIVRHDMLDYAFEVEHTDNHLGRMIAELERAETRQHAHHRHLRPRHALPARAKATLPGQQSRAARDPLSRGMKNPAASSMTSSISSTSRRRFSTSPASPKGQRHAAHHRRELAGIIESEKSGRKSSPRATTRSSARSAPTWGARNDWGYPIRGIVTDGYLFLKNYEPTRWPAGNPETGYLDTDASPTKTLILEMGRKDRTDKFWQLNFGMRPAEELYDLTTSSTSPSSACGAAGRALRLDRHENVVALVRYQRGVLRRRAQALPRSQDLHRLAEVPRAEGHRRRGHLHADHHHAFIANWALNRGLHVYCEKPLAITVEEARVVRANWLTKKGKLATQVGMQRHADPNFNRIRELIRDGAIGDCNPPPPGATARSAATGYFPAEGAAARRFPLGPVARPLAASAPTIPPISRAAPGMNCLEWNMFWDWGAGQIGDMGSHTMDLLWNAVDASCPPHRGQGRGVQPGCHPGRVRVPLQHPGQRLARPDPRQLVSGRRDAALANRAIDLKAIDHGAYVQGQQGLPRRGLHLAHDLPFGADADLSYYTPGVKRRNSSRPWATSRNSGSTPARTRRSRPPAISNTAPT
jgi:hypothetical protein